MKSLLLFCLLIKAAAFASELEITINGESYKKISGEEIKKLKSKSIVHMNHVVNDSEPYLGPSMQSIIESFVPHIKKEIKEIEFSSKNGYKAYFSVEKFEQVDSILAYSRSDQKNFVRLEKKENKIVELGPYYLVWNSEQIARELDHEYKSVYQVNKIGFNTAKLDFYTYKVDVAESAFLGYRSYHNFCLSCHAIGNRGGSLSYNLLKRDVLSPNKRKWLLAYILDPKSIKKDSTMPALPDFKNRQKMAEGIIEYLEFANDPVAGLKKNKIDPKSERGQGLLLEIRKAVDFEFHSTDNSSLERKKYGDLLNVIDDQLKK